MIQNGEKRGKAADPADSAALVHFYTFIVNKNLNVNLNHKNDPQRRRILSRLTLEIVVTMLT